MTAPYNPQRESEHRYFQTRCVHPPLVTVNENGCTMGDFDIPWHPDLRV